MVRAYGKRDNQARRKVSEQDQTEALGGVWRQRSGEDEGPEGNLGHQQAKTRGKADKQRRNGLGG